MKRMFVVSIWRNSWCGCLRPPWREQGLAGARGADQQDVRLLELDVGPGPFAEVDPLVVVVDRDRELLLRLLLADHVVVEQLLEFLGLRQRRFLALFQHPVLGDDVEADVDALVANEDGRAGDELLDLSLALAAERAPQRVVATVLLRHDWSFRLVSRVSFGPFARTPEAVRKVGC